MAISTLLGVYHELRPAELVVLGSVLSLYCVFTPLILTTAWWGGAYGYPWSQWGKLGYRELRCLAYLPITVSPPWPGCGHVTKVRLLRVSSELLCWTLQGTLPLCTHGGWGLAISSFPPHGDSQSGAGECEATHKKQQGEEPPADTHGPLNPAVLLLGVSVMWAVQSTFV